MNYRRIGAVRSVIQKLGVSAAGLLRGRQLGRECAYHWGHWGAAESPPRGVASLRRKNLVVFLRESVLACVRSGTEHVVGEANPKNRRFF